MGRFSVGIWGLYDSTANVNLVATKTAISWLKGSLGAGGGQWQEDSEQDNVIAVIRLPLPRTAFPLSSHLQRHRKKIKFNTLFCSVQKLGS